MPCERQLKGKRLLQRALLPHPVRQSLWRMKIRRKACFVLSGSRSRSMKSQNGTKMQSLESLFIGDSIPCRHSSMNGIHEICIEKDRRNTSITSRPMDCRIGSATKTSYPCSRPSVTTLLHGRSYSKRQAQSTLCPIVEGDYALALFNLLALVL